MVQNNLHLTIASGIFPPDIGGPATYTRALGQRLVKKGIKVTVVCYSDDLTPEGEEYPFHVKRISRRYILPLRYAIYLITLLRSAAGSNLIYAMGPVSDGLPAWIASKLLRKPLLIRLGGDFVWERSLEMGKTLSPLSAFYHEPQCITNRIFTAVVKTVLSGANRLIFSTNFQMGIYERDLGIIPSKNVVIENPVPHMKKDQCYKRIIREPKEIFFAGRLIRKNNLDILIRAFAGINPGHNLKLRIIGEGPQESSIKDLIGKLGLGSRISLEPKLSNSDLLNEVEGAYIVVLPALTDISPNFALECLALRVPVLLTKETGFYDNYSHKLIFFDPTNNQELQENILDMLDQDNYQRYSEVISNLKFDTSWSDVVARHLLVFSEMLVTKEENIKPHRKDLMI